MVHRSRGRPSPAEGNNKIKIAARPRDRREPALGCGRWVRAMSRAVCNRTSAASLGLHSVAPSVADKHGRGLMTGPRGALGGTRWLISS